MPSELFLTASKTLQVLCFWGLLGAHFTGEKQTSVQKGKIEYKELWRHEKPFIFVLTLGRDWANRHAHGNRLVCKQAGTVLHACTPPTHTPSSCVPLHAEYPNLTCIYHVHEEVWPVMAVNTVELLTHARAPVLTRAYPCMCLAQIPPLQKLTCTRDPCAPRACTKISSWGY